MRRILVAGLSHRTTPVEIRERVAVAPRDYPQVLSRLLEWPGVQEGAVLSTCNRSEVYAVANEDGQVHLPGFTRHLAERNAEGKPLAGALDLEPYLFCLDGEEAVTHLFEVAAGVDSAIIGEPQILGQVRETFASAKSCGTLGAVLERLFQRALEVGKRVRTETEIGAFAVSVPFAAVELARKIFESLAGRPALIIGTGEMGELTMRHLLGEGVSPVYVASHSTDRVTALAERLGTELVARDVDAEALADVDVVVAASGAPHSVLRAEIVRAAMTRRRQRPLFLIDIAVPRNIDPGAADVYNVFLYDIDDLSQVVSANKEKRERQVARARSIISEETARFLAWYRGLSAVPTVVALRARLDAVRGEEEARILARLSHLSERDRQLVARFGSTLVNRILHEPTVRLRAASSKPSYDTLADAVGYLFGLDGHAAGSDATHTPAPNGDGHGKETTEVTPHE